MQRQPTLLSSCARAATAAEARYRITVPSFSPRESRVIGLDERSARVVAETARRPWAGGHFLVFETALPDDALLRHASGGTALLSEELAGADAVVMVAAARESAEPASIVGDAAAALGIMSAGVVLPADGLDQAGADVVVSALRPNAMVLVVLKEADDLADVLSALRV
jgi:hypothetical protein